MPAAQASRSIDKLDSEDRETDAIEDFSLAWAGVRFTVVGRQR
jgi:hypothetical protein